MLDAFAGAQMKASPPLLFAILPTIGAIICFVSASVGGDPVETYVSFDVVKKFVTFAFTVYNIQFFFFPAYLIARNFGDSVTPDKFHFFISRFAGFIGTIVVVSFWYMEDAIAYKFICVTTGGIALLGPAFAALYLPEGPEFMAGPILMFVMGCLIGSVLL